MPLVGGTLMVRASLVRRLFSALAGALLVLLLGSSYSYAADCVGPDDPPGCVTPAPSVSPDPSPSVTPVVEPAPSASVTADPVTVVLGDEQFSVLLWIGGAVLAVSLVGVVGSWSR